MSLTVFKTDDGIELVIDTISGESFASQSAVGRMCEKGESTIRQFLTSQKITVFSAEILTATGLKTSHLLNEDGITDCLEKYNSKMLKKFAKLGLRVSLHKLAGFDVNSTAVEQPKTALEYAKLFVASEEARITAEEKTKLLEIENEDLTNDVDRLSEVVDELFDYSSIIRIAKYNNCSETAFNWRKLKAASCVKRLAIKRAPCPRYVTKNLYHHDVWRLVYPDFKLPETTTLVIKK